MTTLRTGTTPFDTDAERSPAHRLAVGGALVGIVGAIIEGVTNGLMSLTPDTGPYQYAADYWLTAAAVPVGLGSALVVVGLHRLHAGRDGRLGRVGVALALLGLLAVVGVCTASLMVGHDVQGGPTYVLGTVVGFVGTTLVAIGFWRAGLLTRWLVAVWPVAWGIGSFFAVSVSPWLLGAWYVCLLVLLRRFLSP